MPEIPPQPVIPHPAPALGNNNVRPYTSYTEWIEDAKRRAVEFRKYGPRGPITWILAEHGEVPRDAISAGEDIDGGPLFISRSFHEGGLLIEWASKRGAALSWGGREVPLTTYEVLTGDLRAASWTPSTVHIRKPIEAGYESDRKALWVAQVPVDGRFVPGRTAGWDTGKFSSTSWPNNNLGTE